MLCVLCTEVEDCYYCGQGDHGLGDAMPRTPFTEGLVAQMLGVLPADSLPPATPQRCLSCSERLAQGHGRSVGLHRISPSSSAHSRFLSLPPTGVDPRGAL